MRGPRGAFFLGHKRRRQGGPPCLDGNHMGRFHFPLLPHLVDDEALASLLPLHHRDLLQTPTHVLARALVLPNGMSYSLCFFGGAATF